MVLVASLDHIKRISSHEQNVFDRCNSSGSNSYHHTRLRLFLGLAGLDWHAIGRANIGPHGSGAASDGDLNVDTATTGSRGSGYIYAPAHGGSHGYFRGAHPVTNGHASANTNAAAPYANQFARAFADQYPRTATSTNQHTGTHRAAAGYKGSGYDPLRPARSF